MKIYFSICVLLSVECITGLDPTLDGDPRRTFPARRAIDGSRGRKYYVPEEEDTFDIYGASGQYDPYRDTTDFSDIRTNVPGEPGVDYPSYVTIPQTSFQCQSQYRGYYADEEAGCQLFHVCDGNFLVSSFLCPIGATFSQKLLTCDWWNKVDCSSTRNYHIVNRDSLLSEVDDDEILRKAYEMTSLQTSRKDVSIDSRTRNSILESARFINDLQTSPNRYGDYADNSPEVQYKYSSRYNSGDYRDRASGYFPTLLQDNQQNPRIKVHTIGQDHKNDADHKTRDFRPSYAPTVPTVTTTTRRFYSPTVPTTSARPMSRPRHDLEFESSDHLYSARGKTTEPSVNPVTRPTVDTTTSVVVDVPPTLTDAYQSKIEDRRPQSQTSPKYEAVTEVTMDKAQVVTQFSAIEFQSVYSGENYTFQIDVDDQNSRAKETGSAEIPSTNIIPPFFYYSKNQETNTTSSNQFIINVPATDVIPPLFSDFSNETRKDYVDNHVVIPSEEIKSPFTEIKSVSPIIQDTPRAEENISFLDESVAPPSRLFLPPVDDFQLENYTNVIQNDVGQRLGYNNGPNGEEGHRDSTEGESSPYQVSLTVKGSEEFNPRGALIKRLLAQHESSGDIRDIEIEKSERSAEPLSDLQSNSTIDSSAAGDASRAQIINYAVLNKLQEIRPLGSLSDLRNADHLPRPFSLDTRKGVGRSPGGPGVSEKKLNEGQESEANPHEGVEVRKEQEVLASKNDTPLKFDLPDVARTTDFRSEEKLKDSGERVSGDKEETSDKEKDGTEFIPSIGFSLNTAEERKEYTEAVIRGLFTDLSSPSVNRSIDNSESS
ncbi:uncharacterized protein LOC107036146 [Diachasma alloeum]|uniref:uncharacterized protein LOC107036146 n=1 Tax=Diachasma alloeum TaxID=454923 RepID=UPI0007384428|nr:uncharacterized protein LOC107036146 [Diachasma alloeum]